MALSNDPGWWRSAIFYQIYPRSFYDSNNDGVGDLKGITLKLDYLKDLGVDAIWLSPIYQSPMFDFGYDISDYSKIDKDFGTLNDFKELLTEAHKRGIRIILDLIMNHTSHLHKWFIESSSSLTNPKRDWYIWRKSSFVQTPTNWQSVFGGSGWQYDDKTKEYYYHSFLKEQPDLNWRNKELRETFFNEVKFWLELGVDGFRLDVLNFIIKDKQYRDNPTFLGIPLLQKHTYTRNRPKALKIIEKLRLLIDSYPNKMLVAEIYLPHPGNSRVVANYLGNGKNGVNLAFDFSMIYTRWSAHNYANCYKEMTQHLPAKGWPTLVLSNHDLLRSYNRLWFKTNREQKARIEAVLLLTLKGTPFLYYGEEIGMKNKRIPYNLIKDPLGKKFFPLFSGRDKARTPMQWDKSKNSGFTKATPWLPINDDYQICNVNSQLLDDHSIVNSYKKLIKLRKTSIALRMGDWQLISTKKNVLIYQRMALSETAIVLINFSARNKTIETPALIIEKTPIFTTSNEQTTIKCSNKFKIRPYEALIFITSNNKKGQ